MILVKDQNNQMILNDNVKWLRRRQLCKFKLLIQIEREKLVGKDTEWTLTVIIIYFKKFYFFIHAMVILNIADCGQIFHIVLATIFLIKTHLSFLTTRVWLKSIRVVWFSTYNTIPIDFIKSKYDIVD